MKPSSSYVCLLALCVSPLLGVGVASAAFPDALAPGDIDASIFGAPGSRLGEQSLILNHPGVAECGEEISPVSDFNDDGFDEVVLGQPRLDNGVTVDGDGVAAVFLGRERWETGLGFEDADLLILNDGGGRDFPSALAVADLNGDCVADLVIGHSSWDGERGRVYVFFGSPSIERAEGLPQEIMASSADMIYQGSASGDALGAALVGGGDVTGDDIADLLMGAPGAQGVNESFLAAGRVYIASSNPSNGGGSVSDVGSDALPAIIGTVGFANLGETLALGPDIDGGGVWDVLLSSPNNSGGGLANSGETYLIRGEDLENLASQVRVSDIDWVTFYGESSGDLGGSSFAFLGDVNGDGSGDLAIASPANSAQGADSGAAYVFYGPQVSRSAPRSLSLADVIYYGAAAGDALGVVAPGGDVTGDGLGDLVLGVSSGDGSGLTDAGVMAIFNGGEGAISGPPFGAADTTLEGSVASERLGSTLDTRGDVDGDGVNDVLVSAPGFDGFAGRVLILRSGLFGDVDGDGISAFDGDCDDLDSESYPGADDHWCDGIDQDCDGEDFTDEDGDGVPGCEDLPEDILDCDDENPDIYPGAEEICDGFDGDCDRLVDEGTLEVYYADEDGDGFGGPIEREQCGPGDPYVALGGDCDDANPDIYPEAEEVCDGEDSDCDGTIDEEVATTYYQDLDLDGYGEVELRACERPTGSALVGGDCDDFDEDINPGQAEQCFDEIDQDCTGGVSDRDLDGDGYVTAACTDYEGDFGGDCDDNDPDVSPGSPEICGDGLDNDCSGAEDDIPSDDDGDGFVTAFCGGPDCDDTDPAINPDAEEVCDEVDNNCSGTVDDLDDDGDGASACGEGGDCDDGDNTIFPGADDITCDGIDQDCSGSDETDGDGDGFPACGEGELDCDDDDRGINPSIVEVPYDGVDQDCSGEDANDLDDDGYIGVQAGGDDCDDDDDDSYPGGTEIPYDGVDQDCSGADLTDVDGDGADFTEVGGGDCDDDNPAIGPDAQEVPYDGIDQDCTGADLTDVDGDGHDALEVGGDDCDDEVATTHPGAYEDPYNEVDDDCDLRVDNYDGAIDHDGDGYVVGGEGPDDCEPLNPEVSPGVTEVLGNSVDDDCDGFVDEPDTGYGEAEGGGCGCDAEGDGTSVPESAGLFLLSSAFVALIRRRRPGLSSRSPRA